MNIFYLEIWCFKGLAVWQEVSTRSDDIRPPTVCLFVYRCWGWLDIVVVVVVVGGEQRALVPLAGPDRQRCPPQANSSNYRKVDIEVKGHDWVNRLVQWWCIASPSIMIFINPERHTTYHGSQSPALVTDITEQKFVTATMLKIQTHRMVNLLSHL